MRPLRDQALEGTNPAGSQSTNHNPTSCKRKPGPELHSSEHGKVAQPGELVWRSLREEQEWARGGMGPSQNPQEDIPTLVYNAVRKINQ